MLNYQRVPYLPSSNASNSMMEAILQHQFGMIESHPKSWNKPSSGDSDFAAGSTVFVQFSTG
jgi:hypothetical protein